MPLRGGVRLSLALCGAALGAAGTVVPLVLGLPLAARGSLGARSVVALALTTGLLVLALSLALLFRSVARPLDRLLAAAARLGTGPGPTGEPLLGEAAHDAASVPLSRAAVAFERLARALEEERCRLARKVEELTDANQALAHARETLLRAEKLATVGRLASGLAHEVGNPLGAVQGYVELARTRLPPDPHPDLVDALARISTAAGRIDRTVRDLLDFARPAQPALSRVDLAAAVDASVRLARVQARFKGVEVEVDVPALGVVADEHQLSQVLLNLLLNAGDAMRGAGRVRLAARAAGAEVVLAVEDDGPGIPPDDLPRIFDPFFTTKEPGEGTGLGLSITHRIVESFGGEISAGRSAGGGARFELRFRAAA